MKKNTGNIFIFIGCLLMLCGVLLTCFNIWSQWNAGRASQEILDKMVISETTAPDSDINDENTHNDRESGSAGTYAGEKAYDDGGNMSGIEIDGDVYVGVLDIPALGLTLPVMQEMDYKKLRLAPCRYRGSAEERNLIIAGHNYKTHFGRLGKLSVGDSISFTDVGGNVYNYTVSETKLIDGSNSAEMTAGEWDLSLFTCNLSGAARVTVRCSLADNIQS